ncbi:hypothetical protein AB0F52_39000 [Amycolatopsis sp. NPDC024027]|uniref:hypothetical protein n=1 Tax=Amycolatopsis sp. NPDC024027 TaxID=3154327 RepID=UPI0033FCE5E8
MITALSGHRVPGRQVRADPHDPVRALDVRELVHKKQIAVLAEGQHDAVGGQAFELPGRLREPGLVEPHLLDRDAFGVGRDLGLAVELEHQRQLARVVPVELLGQADLDGDPVEAPFERQLEDVLAVQPRLLTGVQPELGQCGSVSHDGLRSRGFVVYSANRAEFTTAAGERHRCRGRRSPEEGTIGSATLAPTRRDFAA